MKRARNRQSPSSCQSCRARKLRCDQVQPCANCVARHEDCVFVVPPQKRQSLPVASADLNIAELRERVQWLEALLLPRNLSGRSQATAPSVSGSPLPPHLRQQEDGDHEIDVLNDIGTNDASLVWLPTFYLSIRGSDQQLPVAVLPGPKLELHHPAAPCHLDFAAQCCHRMGHCAT